ncbi:MAG: ion transporter [Desulfobacteraceae bacterium]|nr:ion transporter [Desulfobacteraceae bacterium]MCB9494237.1 ion transporter [Desulfobacteraceae bacterium]
MQSVKKTAEVFIFICILLSCIIIPIDYIFPAYRSLWIKIEIFFALLFSVEYIIRWWFAENKFKYPFTFYAVIDLLAILPSILLLSTNFMMFRLFRMARLLRLLRLIRYNDYLYNSLNNFRNKISALRDEYQLDNLYNLFVMCVIALIAGANIVYFTEIEFADSEGPFSDYWKSYWHMIIVLVSGIEDKEPVSLAGKAVVTIFLIAGICVVGMVTAEIVSILVRKFNRKGKIRLKPFNSKMENHIVILGFNKHLDYVIRQLYNAFSGRYYILAVCTNADELMVSIPLVYKRVVALKGEPLNPEILKKADIDSAKRVIVLSQNKDEKNIESSDHNCLMKAIALNAVNKNVPVTVQLNLLKTMKFAKVMNNTDFVVSSVYSEKLISQGVLNPGVTEIYRSLMTFSSDSCEFYKVKLPDFFGETSFNEIQKYFFTEDNNIIPAGVYKFNKTTGLYDLIINPFANKFRHNKKHGLDFRIESCDYLILIAYEEPSIESDKKHEKKLKKHGFKYFKNNKFVCVDDYSVNSSFKSLENNNIIICNINSNLKSISDELLYGSREKDFKLSIIIQDENLMKNNPSWCPFEHENLRLFFGDPANGEVLEKAGIKNCGAAIILADPNYGDYADAPSTLTAMAIEKFNPAIHTVMELIDSSNREFINMNVINEAVCLGDITEKLIAQNSFNPGVIEIFDNLLTSGKGTPEIFLPEIPPKLKNKTFYEIYKACLDALPPFIVIGFIENNQYFINPREKDAKERLLSGRGSRLIVIAHDFKDIVFDEFNL